MQYEFTDQDGKFGFYTENAPGREIYFQDVDAQENGLYKELMITIPEHLDDTYTISVNLEEQ